MAKPYSNTYSNEIPFAINRGLQEVGKNTAVFHKDIIKHIEKFSKTSAIQIHADILKKSLEHLDSGWAAMLKYEIEGKTTEDANTPDTESTYRSLWMKYAKFSEEDDLFLTVRTKTLSVIPLFFWKDSQNEEIQSWAEHWHDKYPELIWSYSLLTVTALLWVVRYTTASVVTESENAIHICGIYQGNGRGVFEQIDVIIDNEPALRTAALLKKPK